MNHVKQNSTTAFVKDVLFESKAISGNTVKMIATALIAPLSLVTSQLERMRRAGARTQRRAVQQQATQKLIQRQIIERRVNNLYYQKPGWDAPIYDN